MTAGATIWLAIFLLSAIMFFVLASIIAVKGFRDLISLLSKSDRSDHS